MHPGTTLVDAAKNWPTPDASVAQDGETAATWLKRKAAMKAKGYNGNGCGTPLAMAATTWKTPHGFQATAADQWPTPAHRDYRFPNARPYSQRGGKSKGEQLNNFVEHQFSLPAQQTTKPGKTSSPSIPNSPPRQLNPTFVECLMGIPIGWTHNRPLASNVYAHWETACRRYLRPSRTSRSPKPLTKTA
jgi:hypothetical protein